jgi:hypothetical protein
LINENESEMTLDPPGRIAIIGAGPLGLEAALYGRFLGYDVTVLERGQVGQSLRELSDQPLPMLPSACLSPLAWSAISAQRGGSDTLPAASLPLTIGQWLAEGLLPLAATDLLRGRILTGHEVTAVDLVEVAFAQERDEELAADQAPGDQADGGAEAGGTEEPAEYIDGEVPADFRLSVRVACADELAVGPQSDAGASADRDPSTIWDFEALILATGAADAASIVGLDHCRDSPYLFRLCGNVIEAADQRQSAEQCLRAGWRGIVQIFAQLSGRQGQDLYRPLRL